MRWTVELMLKTLGSNIACSISCFKHDFQKLIINYSFLISPKCDSSIFNEFPTMHSICFAFVIYFLFCKLSSSPGGCNFCSNSFSYLVVFYCIGVMWTSWTMVFHKQLTPSNHDTQFCLIIASAFYLLSAFRVA